MASVQKTWATVLICGAALVTTSGCASGNPRGRSATPEDSVQTGYGAQSRADVSGSVSSISTENLKSQPTTMEQWLATRVPGLEVIRLSNGDFTLKVHGAASFMMNTEPLVVVDGSPLPPGGLRSALSGINPQDVARIDVLKEGGSTAIYGTRGGNGVVVITTKRGGQTPKRP